MAIIYKKLSRSKQYINAVRRVLTVKLSYIHTDTSTARVKRSQCKQKQTRPEGGRRKFSSGSATSGGPAVAGKFKLYKNASF